MGYQCRIVCDSISPAGVRLTTVEATFPRFILAEVNTHRMLSRSSASSRAIPVEKRIRMVQEDPFIPEAFGKNQKGMQAAENLEGEEAELARDRWNRARSDELYHAGILARLGVHKQYANRRLEADSFHTAVITATEWSNVDALRAHPDAQPEFQKIWRMAIAAREASTPRPIGIGEWHLPYVRDVDEDELMAWYSPAEIAQISCARSGRVSYLTQDGKREPNTDIELYKRYLGSFHMSPLEHAATPYDRSERAHRNVAMVSLQKTLDAREEGTDAWSPDNVWIGNFRGWVQQRKLITNEHDFSLRGAP